MFVSMSPPELYVSRKPNTHHVEHFHHSNTVDVCRVNCRYVHFPLQHQDDHELLVLDRHLNPVSRSFQAPHFSASTTLRISTLLMEKTCHEPEFRAQEVHKHDEPCCIILLHHTRPIGDLSRPLTSSACVSQVEPPQRSYFLRLIGHPAPSVSVKFPQPSPSVAVQIAVLSKLSILILLHATATIHASWEANSCLLHIPSPRTASQACPTRRKPVP